MQTYEKMLYGSIIVNILKICGGVCSQYLPEDAILFSSSKPEFVGSTTPHRDGCRVVHVHLHILYVEAFRDGSRRFHLRSEKRESFECDLWRQKLVGLQS